ncbi:MAG: glycosyltransferase [Nitriliruptorales bacterium]
MTRPLRVLTWHVHGSYLENLVRAPHEFFLPVRDGRPEGYGGCLPGLEWGPNVHEVPAEDVERLALDVIIFQSRRNWEIDQFDILSPAQARLPRIFLEHDPPREAPTDTRHVVDQPDVLLVHVTPFNELMWDCGRTPTRVIDHGVAVPVDVPWSGERDQGITVVNCLERRGRRAGADVFLRVRDEVPLDLVGMESERLGGLGEVPRDQLAAFEARYRFFFNPIRYTSLGLAVLEAMAIGMPVVGLATTEMATAIENGVSGYVDTNVDRIVEAMHDLLRDRAAAAELGEGARRRVLERFHIERFLRDWNTALDVVAA